MKGEKNKMKCLSLIVLGLTLIISGAIGCNEESASGPEEGPPAAVNSQTNPQNTNQDQNNNPNAVPDDLGGTNLTPPPAPPGH